MKAISFIRSLLALTIGRQVQKSLGILQLLEVNEALTVTDLHQLTGFRKMEIARLLSQLCARELVEDSFKFFPQVGDSMRYTMVYSLTEKGKQYLEDRRNG